MAESKVSERLEWLIGERVAVKVAYSELGQVSSDAFDGVYVDTVPMGREYFFVFEVDGARRLLRTSSVVEVRQIPRVAHA